MNEIEPLTLCCSLCAVLGVLAVFIIARLIEFTLEDMRNKLKKRN